MGECSEEGKALHGLTLPLQAQMKSLYFEAFSQMPASTLRGALAVAQAWNAWARLHAIEPWKPAAPEVAVWLKSLR